MRLVTVPRDGGGSSVHLPPFFAQAGARWPGSATHTLSPGGEQKKRVGRGVGRVSFPRGGGAGVDWTGAKVIAPLDDFTDMLGVYVETRGSVWQFTPSPASGLDEELPHAASNPAARMKARD